MRLPERPDWFAQAECRGTGPRKFFPEGHESAAHAICQRCPVRVACLDYALDDPTLVGIWGGTNETQRDHLRSKK